jgi:type VI secretion system protein ImpA
MTLLGDTTLVETILDGSQAGPNLELDPEFGALERAAQGRPEQQYGDTIIAAAEPDWNDVEAQAIALLSRTRDLRVLVHLAVARLHLTGLPTFAAMLGLTRQLLASAWQQVHPQLDPEDDNDPTLRANALLRLAHPSVVLRYIRDLPLASSPRLGRFSWRDIALATGALDIDPDQERPSEAMIRSAFQDSDLPRLADLRAAAATAGREATAIVALFDDNSGYGTGPDFSPLTRLLSEVVRDIDRYVIFPAAPAEDASLSAPTPEQMDPAPGLSASGLSAPGLSAPGLSAAGLTAPRPPGGGTEAAARFAPITTRADAMRLLDLVCQYYRSYEPSSPLPILLERARRLADKDFMEILRDLAPDGLAQAQTIAGTREE